MPLHEITAGDLVAWGRYFERHPPLRFIHGNALQLQAAMANVKPADVQKMLPYTKPAASTSGIADFIEGDFTNG